MKPSRIVSTTGFRLSALYLGLFLFSFLAVGVTVYYLTSHILEQQMIEGVELDALSLKAEYEEGGIKAVKDEIEGKKGAATVQAHLYGVLDSRGKLVAGDIDNFNRQAGWQKVGLSAQKKKESNADDDDVLHMKVMPLSSDYWLGVGYHSDYVEEAIEAIIDAFSWGAVLVLVMGGMGGFYMTRSFLKKIEAITGSTHAIIAGDIRHRLTISENRDELDNLAVLLNRMLDKICQLIENVQQVSNDVAHDLRTPISHLKFRLEDMLHKDLTPKQYKANIGNMVEDVDMILNTFSAILRISQIESGSRRSGFSQVNISDIMLSVSEALEPVADEKGKHLTYDIVDNLFLSGDKELLTQLAYNLIENAVVHTPVGSRIHVTLHSEGDAVRFTVADNGSGIPETSRDKVFQRFYRLEKSRTTPGSGLGLSIVAAIAELHEARMTVLDNEPGLKIVIDFL